MTLEAIEAAFQRRLIDLLELFDRTLAAGAPEPFVGAGGGRPLEHTTRIHFLDDLMELLGWQLGVRGNVEEEVRLRGETTVFVDYLGIQRDTNTPTLLLEAKAWDVLFITPQGKGENTAYEASGLIAQAIEHLQKGGGRKDSPAAADWHDYLGQVQKYVRRLRDTYNHPLPRAVLTSGQWMVVFTRPVDTFLDKPPRPDDIKVFHKPDYRDRAFDLYKLLAKDVLAVETPYQIRYTQVPGYIKPEEYVACFHALHVSYEATGSQMYVRRPRILVYPALILLRNDKALITIFDETKPLGLPYHSDEGELDRELRDHLSKVNDATGELLELTGRELGIQLEASAFEDFPGYPTMGPGKAKSWVKSNPRVPDAWMVVTGKSTHFIEDGPRVDCVYHRWAACNAARQADTRGAVSMPVMAEPRSYFTDEQPHHCAHQGLRHSRDERCQVRLIDERLCCQTCIYEPICWPADQRARLPCGR